MIYLDYNATTPLCSAALEAMRPYLERHFGNPSSIHQAGREARAAIDESRDRLASLLCVRPNEIVFTSGGTESDNLGIIGLARAHSGKGRHLITSATEHHAVLHAFDYLEKRDGFDVTRLPVDRDGCISLDRLSAAIRPDTTLLSLMSANNETGAIQPLTEAADICRAHGILVHSDMIQSFGKLPIDLAGLDAVSIAAHKFYGPKGAGLLWVRSGIPIDRLQVGGSHENERRAGTENVPAIAGMAAAAEASTQNIEAEMARQAGLREKLWAGIESAFPQAIQNSAAAPCLPNTLSVSFNGTDTESLLINLDLNGICASSGSACMVGSVLPSHVLLAMGVPPLLANSTVRFSIGKPTTSSDIETALARLPAIFERLLAT